MHACLLPKNILFVTINVRLSVFIICDTSLDYFEFLLVDYLTKEW